MKNRIFLFLLAITPFFTNAQHSEVGLMIGASVYQGDLTPSNVWSSIGETHVAYGAFYRYNINDYVAVKLGLTQGTISGDDVNSKDEGRESRNLSFKSGVTELAITGEFNILGYQPYNLTRPFSPYVFAGVAVYRFNPKAELDDKWYELQPLGTEGQNLSGSDKSAYNLTQVSIPFGIGAKYALNDTWNIGIELGSRYTFTDYLDDVSTTFVGDNVWAETGEELTGSLANRSEVVKFGGEGRGNSKNKDWYLIGGITVSYNFLDNGLSGFRNRNSRSKDGCPGF
ncbi:MAG: opacity protein-like surface antigen [Polaribacter sp.]|jgi:opacity protein-like surface antigen